MSALFTRPGTQVILKPKKTVATKYSIKASTAREVLMYNQGEDRKLSCLLLENGWQLQYCASAIATTHCVESFESYFIQRKRWISSTDINIYQLIGMGRDIVQKNPAVSMLFIMYTAIYFFTGILGPATVIIVSTGGILYGFESFYLAGILGYGMPAFYVFILWYFGIDLHKDSDIVKKQKQGIHIKVAFIFSVIYAVLMAVVVVGIVSNMVTYPLAVDSIYFYCLAAIFIFTSIIHGELMLLVYGIVYWFLLPMNFLLLRMFAVANMHDQRWVCLLHILFLI